MFSLKHRVIVITGGMGLLGQEYVKSLTLFGARVIVLDKHPDSDVVANVTSKPSLEAALLTIKKEWGVPHGLVNNAALDSPPSSPNHPFETYPEESWDAVMDVNAKGVFLCCQVFGTEMAKAKRGVIVNISSTYGIVSPDQRIYDNFTKPVAYSASKSAVVNLTRYLATYWADKNIRVNTLTLGGVWSKQDESFVDAYCARVPLGRMAYQHEYNGALIFLLSDASSYMTGSNLVIDGGWTAW